MLVRPLVPPAPALGVFCPRALPRMFDRPCTRSSVRLKATFRSVYTPIADGSIEGKPRVWAIGAVG